MNRVISLVLVLEIICLLQFCQIHSSVIKKSHLSGWIDVMVHIYLSRPICVQYTQWRSWNSLSLICNIQLLSPSPGRKANENTGLAPSKIPLLSHQILFFPLFFLHCGPHSQLTWNSKLTGRDLFRRKHNSKFVLVWKCHHTPYLKESQIYITDVRCWRQTRWTLSCWSPW